MHIACAIDEGYVQPLLGMLSSFSAQHRGTRVCLHLLSGPLTAASHRTLETFIQRQDVDYHHYPIPPRQFESLHLAFSHFSQANFYRLLIPERVTTTSRVLYLDADILVRQSLMPLYDTDLGDCPVAAAPDAYPPADCKRLGIPEDLGYFNSGILLMDLAAWRRERIADQVMAYLSQHNGNPQLCRYADQDGLNMVLQGRWHRLDESWNFNIYHCTVDPQQLSQSRRQVLRQGPAVIHFADRKKPWIRDYALPYQQEYLKAARRNGICFPNTLTIRTLWPRIQEHRKLLALKTGYRRARCPWRA